MTAPRTMPDAQLPSIPWLTDWSTTVTFQPRFYYRPQSEAELAACLEGLLAGKPYAPQAIRVPGSMHSTCDIVVADAIVDIADLPHTLEFNADFTQVIASANWRLHDFLLALSQATPRGKSLAATGGTDEQTLAGLISTNTAPPTNRATIWDLLQWVEFMAPGPGGAIEVRRVNRGEPDFDAMVCSLGVIGVLLRVGFNLIDEPYYEVVQSIAPLDSVLGDPLATGLKYDFWRINWIPSSDNGLLWAATLLTGKGDPAGDYPHDGAEAWIKRVMDFVQKEGNAGPTLDLAENILLKVLSATYGTQKAQGPLRNMIPIDRLSPLKVALSEWSFDVADTQRVLQVCRAYYATAGWPNLPIEIQLTRTDTHYMSPWNWPGTDTIIKFDFQYLADELSTAHKAGIATHLQGLWQALQGAGIPFKAHWGKINFIDYAFATKNHQLDRFAKFVQPWLVNDYLRARILPPSQGASK